MQLLTLLDRYAHEHEYGVRESTLRNYRWTAGDWQRTLGRAIDVQHVRAEDLTRYIDAMRAKGLAPDTIQQRRAHMMAVLRWARREGLAPYWDADRVRRVRRPPRVIEAWTADEVAELIRAARILRGKHEAGMTWAIYWESFVRAAWDTALRRGDLLSLERDWIRADADGTGCLTLVQRKTGYQHRVWLAESTMQAIDASMSQAPDRRLIWPLVGVGALENWHWRFRRLVRSAGIRYGTPKWLRRGSITSVEAQAAGRGYLHAGHQVPATTQRHYLDRQQLQRPPMPQALPV